jgi:hypothetical protein
MIEKYSSVGCKYDTDCVIVVEHDRCAADCGTAVGAVVAKDLIENLGRYADEVCSTCPPVSIPPCAATRAVCQAGLCRSVPM